MKQSFHPPNLQGFGGFGCTMQHAVSSFPKQGSNPGPLQWKHGVLTTGPGGRFPSCRNFLNKLPLSNFSMRFKFVSTETPTILLLALKFQQLM